MHGLDTGIGKSFGVKTRGRLGVAVVPKTDGVLCGMGHVGAPADWLSSEGVGHEIRFDRVGKFKFVWRLALARVVANRIAWRRRGILAAGAAPGTERRMCNGV